MKTKKKLTLWQRIKRTIIYCSILLFLGFMYAAYSEIAPMFDTTAGKAFSGVGGFILSPLAGSLPWWFWGGVVGTAVYLWIKHKLLMSVVYGVIIGIGWAIV